MIASFMASVGAVPKPVTRTAALGTATDPAGRVPAT
jgi:hypothetical protein